MLPAAYETEGLLFFIIRANVNTVTAVVAKKAASVCYRVKPHWTGTLAGTTHGTA